MKTAYKAHTALTGHPCITIALRSGTEIQFVSLGDSGVMMGVRPKTTTEWTTTMVENPYRFGPFATAKQLSTWVAAFEVDAGQEVRC